MNQTERIEQQAARYIARKQEPQWSECDQQELDAWLKESTSHEVAYLRLEFGWSKVNRMVVLKNAPVKNPSHIHASVNPPSPQADRQRTGKNILLSFAASVTLGTIALFVWRGGMLEGFGHPSYVTQIGGHQTVPLADGSRIELNTNTRVRTDIDDTERKVWLEHGEAYFDIAPDPTRPFFVYAGKRRVTVLGTKFSVRRERDEVRVIVTEGKVRLEDQQQETAGTAKVLQGGDAVTATKGFPPRIQSGDAEHVMRALSWRQGIVTFNQTTLADAAAEFNRYNRHQILVAEDAAQVSIGGSFEATNIDAFVRLLREGFRLNVTEHDGNFHISN